MPNSDETNIPRWAAGLGEGTWNRINELIDAGWRTMDIVRELEIPPEKVRSLQEYVRRFGPRRRLTQFAGFKDALLSQVEQFGDDLVQSLSVIAQLAVSNKTKAATQVRAFEAMTQFTSVLKAMVAEDAKAEEQRKRDEAIQTGRMDPNEAVRAVLARYGVFGDGSGKDD